MAMEMLAGAAEVLTSGTLTGNAALTLALIPVQFLADAGERKLQEFLEKVLPYRPEKVYYDAFLETLQWHKERHDYTAGSIIKELLKKIKKDKNSFYRCVNALQVPYAMVRSPEPFPAHLLAEKLLEEYKLDMTQENQQLLHAILRDCMDHYRQALYRLLNEKGLLLQTLQILMNLQDRASFFQGLLADTASKSDILILKDALLTAVRREEASGWQNKTLAEYDKMIEGQYRYLEFTAGFSPRINARDIRMKMSDVFINLEYVQQRPANSVSAGKQDFDLTSAVMNSRFNVFLGDPGCGKTTLLKKIAFDLVSKENRAGGTLSNFIPLYFRLADYSRFYKDTHKGIAEFLQQTKLYQFKKDLFDLAQSERSLVFLMDGLDEIADTPLRINIVDQVNTFVFTNPQYIYFITSRIVGYRDAALHGIFSTYRLEPLNDNKIKEFIYQWHLAVEENTDDGNSNIEKQDAAKKNTDSLVGAIQKNSSVKRLATNPLLLTIITLIHLQGGRLPNKRVELYDICADTFLQHWINKRVDNADAILDRDILIELLSRVAFYIHENYANGLIPEDDFQRKFLEYYQEISGAQTRPLLELRGECRRFINFIRMETGIFAEKGQDEEGRNLFGFLHLTFEEYFSAIEFKRRVAEKSISLKDYTLSPRWREIILLCAALFGGQTGTGRLEASRFVQKILRTAELFPPMHQNLRLALSIMADDVRLTAECEKDVWSRLEAVLQTEPNPDLYNELTSLNTSAVYRDVLRTKVETWLKDGDLLFSNTVILLLRLYEDKFWHDLLAAVPSSPAFPQYLEQFGIQYVPWRNFEILEYIFENWIDGILQYINIHPGNNRVKWGLIECLASYRSDRYPEFVSKFASSDDQFIAHTYQFAFNLFQTFNIDICDIDGKIFSMLSLFFLQTVPTPVITVHTSTQLLNKSIDILSIKYYRWFYALNEEEKPDYNFIGYFGQSSDHQPICVYIIFSSLLEEIQVGIYNAPIKVDEFIEIFGLKERGLELDIPRLADFLSSDKERLPAIWIWDQLEAYHLNYWGRLFNKNNASPDENAALAAQVRQWIQEHGQEDPIRLLLAQMILEQQNPGKSHITLKALRGAVDLYEKGGLPEQQRRHIYDIIVKAIQMRTPHSGRSKTRRPDGTLI